MNKIDKINEVLKKFDLTYTDQNVKDGIDDCTINEIKDCIVDLYHALMDIHDIILFDEEE